MMTWRNYVEISLEAHDMNLKAKGRSIQRLDEMITALEARVRKLEQVLVERDEQIKFMEYDIEQLEMRDA